MKLKSLWLSLATFAVLSGLLLATVEAVGLNLPSSPITMTVADGSTSYFVTTLSGVPAGYNIWNGEYLGWCVDRTNDIPRDTDLIVMLYSSCAPPTGLMGERWDMINYILNHKQGEMEDIKEAIWYFMRKPDGIPEAAWRPAYTPTAAAQAMVDDAEANGTGFVPGPGEVVAVICYPGEEIQISIIELHTYAPKPVGGRATSITLPTTKSQLQASWIRLGTIILPLGAAVVFLELRKKKR